MMKCVLFVVAGVTFTTSAWAQGVPEEWDIRPMVQSLKSQAEHLKPILDQIQPETWVAKGAPAEYVTQWKNSEADLRYLLQSSDAFAKHPDHLPLALDT